MKGIGKMRKVVLKVSKVIMALAIIAAKLNVNSTCSHHLNQITVPDCAKKLSRFND